MFGGAGLGWWLAFGESAMSLGAGSEAGTALGAGALVVVASVRWAVGKWERAKRHWVDDANRVSEGLKRDLKVRTKTTLQWTRLMSSIGHTAGMHREKYRCGSYNGISRAEKARCGTRGRS